MPQVSEPPTSREGPLRGVRVIELAGIGPCPFAAMVLADLGAEVLRIERPSAVSLGEGTSHDLLQRGKRSVGIDLKSAVGTELALRLVASADALVEGFRPGVTERLGLGPAECLAANHRLVYGRMTGWGQDGPMSHAAGHDINYIALSGVLGLIGRSGEAPLPPLNLVADFGGGGMLLALGVAAALFEVARGGIGQVLDVSMVDGSALLSTMIWSLMASGDWSESRGRNLLDTGAPFYEVYECADGKFVALGALEPQFYAAFCRLAGLAPAELSSQMDKTAWPELKERVARVLRTRTRDEWVSRAEADGGDACLAPVLTLDEAPSHPHNAARRTFVAPAGVTQPAPAPRFSSTPASIAGPPCRAGEGGRAALSDWGVSREEVDELLVAEVVRVFDP